MSNVKEMTTKFGKLNKFEVVDFRRWQKKMHFFLTTLKVVYVLSTPMPELVDDSSIEELRKRNKWENDDYICRGHILNDCKHMLKHKKEELSFVQLGSHLRIEESLRAQEGGNKLKGKEAMDPSSINMVEDGEGSSKNKGKKRPFSNISKDANLTPKGACWICGKYGHFKADCPVKRNKKGTPKKRSGQRSKDQRQGSKDQGPPKHQG
ncbi:hypothetical protein RND81_06G099200 [Saponaria officinalis]|uniref:CCHC-type domain-containing protein n=1 Tax=Saponaria officinalis TaxID=3572 RepID=A0AAW1KB79_SAPOF